MPSNIGVFNINSFSGIQALYHLEDTSDSSGNGNTLTNNNGVTFDSAKFSNGANGGISDANKSLSIASNLGYTGGSYSMSLWAKINTQPSGATFDLLEVTDASSDTSLLINYLDAGGGNYTLSFIRISLGVSSEQVTYTASGGLGTSTFHNIILSYDGTTLTGYLNGSSMGSIASSGSGSGATSGFRILEGRTANTNSSLAIVDEVLCTTTALTHKQIKNYYAWASGRFARFL